jgi:hypothetical protein
MMDGEGIINASVPGLAVRAGVSLRACQEGLTCFLSPDPFSRTKDFEGRRIEEVDGGWHVLNFMKYRERQPGDRERERKREWWRKNHGVSKERAAELDRRRQIRHTRQLDKLDASSVQNLTQAEAEAVTDLTTGQTAAPVPNKNRKENDPDFENWSKVANALRRRHAFHPSNPTINEEGVRRFVQQAKEWLKKARKKPSDLHFYRMIGICLYGLRKLDVTDPVAYALGAFKKDRFDLDPALLKKARQEFEWTERPANNGTIAEAMGFKPVAQKE